MTIKSIIWNVALCLTVCTHLSLAATTTRVSVNSLGHQGDGSSGDRPDDEFRPVTISADGRFVVFSSDATNLVGGDTNGKSDVFVHNRMTGTTTRVSVNSRGQEGNDDSGASFAISTNGRYVAFSSSATNLVAGDSNDEWDVFVHDRKKGKTTRVSVSSEGEEANDDSCCQIGMSGDGTLITFESGASNLVANDSGDWIDIFVHDRQNHKTTRVNVSNRGRESNFSSADPVISEDGRYVAFTSYANNLVANDNNEADDIFVRDLKKGKTARVSLNSGGAEGDGDSASATISEDGRYIAFDSRATNLVTGDSNDLTDIFVHDRKSSETTRASIDSQGRQANGHSIEPAISANGRHVAFDSEATNLVAIERKVTHRIYVHNLVALETTLASVNDHGEKANKKSTVPTISAKGRFVAFASDASNLVARDSNRETDVFVHDRDRDIVNGQVSITPRFNSFRLARKGRNCEKGDAGRFLFKARLKNVGESGLADLHVPVTKLNRGNKLVTESGLVGPNGEFPVPEHDDYADSILAPGESVTVPLEVCLRANKRFQLYVVVADDRKTKVIESVGRQAEFRFTVGLDGDDRLRGTGADDILIGFDGNDTLLGKGGDDLILGGRGNDILIGWRGHDEIRGEDGRDILSGGNQHDLLLGGRGDDELIGGGGRDELWGNGGNDELHGGAGNDVILGGPGDDNLLGGGNDDLLKGGSGNDALDGGTEVDICKGGSGENTFRRCEL